MFVNNDTKITYSKLFGMTLLYIKSVNSDLLIRIIDKKEWRVYLTWKSHAKFTDKSTLLDVLK